MHSFDPKIAVLVGVNAAVLYANITWWCAKNEANGRNINEGRAWTYNSVKAWSELFPYLSPKQIRSALLMLEDQGLILSGEFNESSYDRTKWYTPSGNLDLPCRATQLAPEGEPIPVIKPDINLGRDSEAEAYDIYNEFADRFGLGQAKVLSPKRRSAIKKRMAEAGGLEGWKVAIEKAAKSDFLTGKRPTKDGPFVADLDFILQQTSFTRLMEGFYDNRNESGNRNTTRGTHSNGNRQPGGIVGAAMRIIADENNRDQGRRDSQGWDDNPRDVSPAPVDPSFDIF